MKVKLVPCNNIIACNNCNFGGNEDDLIKVVEFKNKQNKNSKFEYLPLNDFIKTYGSRNDNIIECSVIDGCPNCLTDSFLMDI